MRQVANPQRSEGRKARSGQGWPDGGGPGEVTNEQAPLPRRVALRAVIGCAATTVRLLARSRVHLRPERLGRRLRFADGTCAPVFRETVVDRPPTRDPCVLVLTFRLRAARGPGHALFRRESLLNTPLFVGFPGFVSKLWLANDEHGAYRGLYEWDGPSRAEHYARCLWRVLALVCIRGSIQYKVLPGLRRDELLDRPDVAQGSAPEDSAAWWRLVEVT